MSPESLRGELQSHHSDIWALGVLLYELHMNKEPFPGKSSKDMLEMISNRPIPFTSEYFKKSGMLLVKKLLKYRAVKRSSVKEILNSPFLKKLTKEYFLKQAASLAMQQPRQLVNTSLQDLNRVAEKRHPGYSLLESKRNQMTNLNETARQLNQARTCFNWSSNATDANSKVSSSSQSFRYLNMKSSNRKMIPKTAHSKGNFYKELIDQIYKLPDLK
jgi:hypothetical protein